MTGTESAVVSRRGLNNLHSGAGDVLDTVIPAGTQARSKDSAALHLSGGNPWQPLGTWAITPQP